MADKKIEINQPNGTGWTRLLPVTTWDYIELKPSPVLTVTLTGDVSGSGNVTLSPDGVTKTVSFATTIQPDSVALGTDTTGNYVATISNGNGNNTNRVIISNSGVEGAGVTLDLPQDIHTSANPNFANLTLSGDIAVNGGDITTTATAFNLVANNATAVNFATAATAIEIGAATGTTNINNNLDVDGDLNIDGGDLTVSTTTFNLANSTATTLNIGGVATTVNLGSSGAINLGNSSVASTTVSIGGAIGGNTLKIDSLPAGAVNLSSDVTTGTVNLFTGVTTGTVNFANGGASTINIGGTGSTTIVKKLSVEGVTSTGATGTGNIVFATSPSLTTPNIGAATAASVNKLIITQPTNSATLTIADGKTLGVSNTLTFTGTDNSSIAFGAGGTIAYTSNKLNVFATTTSTELAGVISDETGTGALVFNTSPTFSTSIDSSATFGAFGSSNTLTVGYTGTAASTTNISTGAVAASTVKTINIGTGGVASSTTNINIGSSNGGTTTIGKDLVVNGDLTVNGQMTTVNSTTISVDDKNIELGSVAVPTDTTAEAGGITLRGATDKTFNWLSATGSWTSSENINLASGKTYKIAGIDVLTSTRVLGKGFTNASGEIVTVDATQDLVNKKYNGLTLTSTTGTFTLANTKTFAVNNSIALAGTDGTTITLPSTTGTVALNNQQMFIGTTSVAINRASASLGLTGISSISMPGGTNTVVLSPASKEGTDSTTITLPAVTGTAAVASGNYSFTKTAYASAASGATTIKIEIDPTLDSKRAIVKTGDSISGTNIAANTTVSAISLDSGTVYTVTLSNATTGAISSGAILTFSRAAESGYILQYGGTSSASMWAPASAIQLDSGSIANGAITSEKLSTNISVVGTLSAGATIKTGGDINIKDSVYTQVTETSISQSTAQLISSVVFSLSSFTSAEFIVQVKGTGSANSSKRRVSRVIATYDGTNVDFTEYAVIEMGTFSPTPVMSFVASEGLKVTLGDYVASTNSYSVKVIATKIV